MERAGAGEAEPARYVRDRDRRIAQELELELMLVPVTRRSNRA